jgi:hypothetical protein
MENKFRIALALSIRNARTAERSTNSFARSAPLGPTASIRSIRRATLA